MPGTGNPKGGKKGDDRMSADIHDELSKIGKELAVQGERHGNIARDINAIKEATIAQDKHCRSITAGYTASINLLNGRMIKNEGCILSVKGQFKRMITLVIGTATIVSAIGVIVALILNKI